MLTGKNKSKLRSMAQTRKAIVMIGKDGITDNLCESLWNALEAHELVKVSCLKTMPMSVREAAINVLQPQIVKLYKLLVIHLLFIERVTKTYVNFKNWFIRWFF